MSRLLLLCLALAVGKSLVDNKVDAGGMETEGATSVKSERLRGSRNSSSHANIAYPGPHQRLSYGNRVPQTSASGSPSPGISQVTANRFGGAWTSTRYPGGDPSHGRSRIGTSSRQALGTINEGTRREEELELLEFC
jgi:hypothetical protein